MADVLSRGNLFDPVLVTDLINKVKGHSSLANLSQQTPIAFNGQKEFTFTMDSDIDIVAENGQKSHGGISIAPLTIVPIKVEYGARVSDEFIYGSEEVRIDVVKGFNEGYAKKLARGIDLMSLHGINPRSGLASTIIGDNHFDKMVTQTVEFNAADPDANIETAVSLVQGSGGSVSGMAMDPAFSSALAAYKVNGVKQFPELGWGGNPGSINGVRTDINNTVGNGGDDMVVIGDFANMFKWGYAKEIPFEIIKYGDPDGSGKDLKNYNQVYLRSETYVGWGIMDGSNFARVIKPAVVPGG